jgi:glycosyltransferase involved in cell wall biosynthesis
MSRYILAYMDFMSPTGFSRVAHSVLDRLTPWLKEKDIKVDLYALNFGLKEDFDYNSQIKVLNPTKFEGKTKDPYARKGLLTILSLGAYDIVWLFNDIGIVSPMIPHIENIKQRKAKEGRTPFKSLFYTPIDGLPFVSQFENLDKIDEIVTYTQYGKNAMDKAFKTIGKKPKSKITIIPHGMDKDIFKPLENKQALREKYGLPKDAFLYGNINKNQPRKDIGTTLLAFSKLKNNDPKNHKDSVLYLHCYHSDPTGVNLYRVCEQLNLKVEKDVFFPTDEKYYNAEYTQQDMNEVYNCLDVFVNTTTSEGWGLGVSEAMSVGLPIVCPIHTSLNEITDYGELTYSDIKTYEHFQINDGEYVRYVCDPYDVANMMNVAMQNVKKGNVDYLSRYKHKFAEYNWDNIATQFRQLIEKLL